MWFLNVSECQQRCQRQLNHRFAQFSTAALSLSRRLILFFTLFPFLFLCGFHAIRRLIPGRKNTHRASQTDRIRFFSRSSFYYNSHQNERNIQYSPSSLGIRVAQRNSSVFSMSSYTGEVLYFFLLLFKAQVRIIFQNHQLTQTHSLTSDVRSRIIWQSYKVFKVGKRCKGKIKQNKLFKLFSRNENLTENRLNHNPFYPLFSYETSPNPTFYSVSISVSFSSIFNVRMCLFFRQSGNKSILSSFYRFELLRWPSLISE